MLNTFRIHLDTIKIGYIVYAEKKHIQSNLL